MSDGMTFEICETDITAREDEVCGTHQILECEIAHIFVFMISLSSYESDC